MAQALLPAFAAEFPLSSFSRTLSPILEGSAFFFSIFASSAFASSAFASSASSSLNIWLGSDPP
jgi:hypothetical protein